MHDLSLLLLYFGVGVVRRENQVDFSAKRIDADDPEVTRVHLLFQTIRVIHELLMKLAQDQLQVKSEDVLSREVAEFDREIHS